MSAAPTNLICFGDSITEAAEFLAEERWPTLLQAHLDAWHPDGFKVHNRGIGGDTTAGAFDRIENDVLPLLPGVLLVQFGFNDANVRDWSVVPRVGLDEFKKNLEEFHRVAHAHGGCCVLMVNHTIVAVAGEQGNGMRYSDNMEPYNKAIREVARTCQAPVIDLPALLAERQVELDLFVVDDGLHLSAFGNRVYAEMVFGALKEILLPRGKKLGGLWTNHHVSAGDLRA
ncbi:MAG: GDSL-type esterase/lipase family protein [Acidiferrobacterales bacterium]|nr:GDSL-type esterase/lipase family protein [Acidiferrobacterales bacterium]